MKVTYTDEMFELIPETREDNDALHNLRFRGIRTSFLDSSRKQPGGPGLFMSPLVVLLYPPMVP